MKPIYTPKGKAKEYGDLAINIYTGCPHGCYYCFAPSVLRKDKETFHKNVEPRAGIVEAVKRQLEREKIADKLIHLCFTCDPYPRAFNHEATREIIKAIKETGNHVQILTRNVAMASFDFDLLDENDWFGTTITGATREQEPNAPSDDWYKFVILDRAKKQGIKTWVSFEPVLNASYVLGCIIDHGNRIDKIKIGKLNYHPSHINWCEFGHKVEALCKEKGINYYIKEDLRKAMENGGLE